MKTFHQQATQYYIRSSQLFHTANVRVPALIFVSKTDPVGAIDSNLSVRDTWESLGMKVRFAFNGSRENYIINTCIYVADLHEDIRGVTARCPFLQVS